MKTAFKRLTAAVSAAAVMTAAVVFDVPQKIAAAANTHTNHKVCINSVCGDTSVAEDNTCTHGENTNWQIWAYGTDTYSGNGTYYINARIVPNKTVSIKSGETLNLCLNGCEVATAKTGQAIFSVASGGTLNICDCKGGGKITGAVDVSNGGAVTVRGVFNLYSGEISGNTNNGNGSANAGAVYVDGSGAFNMYGGAIKGNETAKEGGGIMCYGGLNIYGGEISGNKAGTSGGGIYDSDYGSFNIYGGTISGNTAGQSGGGICSSNSSTGEYPFNIYGGIISGNTAVNNGGGLYCMGVTNIYDVVFSDNTAKTGGGIYVQNYWSTLNMYGGEITGNTTSSTGGGVDFDSGAKVNFCGKTNIINNHDNNNADRNLNFSAVFTVTDSFDAASRIGIYYNRSLSCKDRAIDFAAASSDVSAAFSSDNDYTVVWENGKLGLKKEHSYPDTYSTDETNHWHECGVCEVKTDEAAHTWNSGTVTKAATCTAKGEKKYTCTVCGQTKTEEIAAKGHTEVELPAVAATCTAAGKTAGKKCSVCGTITKAQTAVAKLAHTEVEVSAVAATCTATGLTAGKKCSVCGTVTKAQTTTAALGHSWDNGKVTKQPTEKETGIMTYICTVCKAEKTEEIPKLDHVHELTHHEKKEADCTNAGTAEYWSCSKCGNNYSDAAGENLLADITISAKGHTEVTDAAVAATCTTTGLTTGSHCSVCGKVITEQQTVAALGHTEIEIPETAATCTQTGLTAGKKCSVCGTVTVPQSVAAVIEHSWNDGAVTVEPTENAPGSKLFTCTVCGGTKTEIVPAIGTGSISTEVKPGANAPAATLQTSREDLVTAALSSDEQELVSNGVDINIVLTVDDATDKTPVEDKTKVETAINGLKNYKLGQYLDVNLLKKIGSLDPVKITETNTPIRVTFEIPTALRKTRREYSVIRVHDGTTDVLRDLDSNSDTVTIETNKFSTYALAYSESSNSSSGSSGSSSRPSGGGRPSRPSGGGSSTSSEPTSSDTSDNTSDNSSDTASSETSSSETSSSDTSASSSETSISSDVSSSSGESTSGSSGTSSDNSTEISENSSENSSEDNAPNESGAADDTGNPATGIAVSCIPLATAAVAFTVAAKRKKK